MIPPFDVDHEYEQDDDNDTFLFEGLQQYVLTHYPNPERLDCLDAATLRAFVYAPETLDLEDRKFLHVFKCAECTRELMAHRVERDQRLELHAARSARPNKSTRRAILKASTAMPLLLFFLVLL